MTRQTCPVTRHDPAQEKLRHNERRRIAPRYRARMARLAEHEQATQDAAMYSDASLDLEDAMSALSWPRVVTLAQLHAVGLSTAHAMRRQWRGAMALRGYRPFPNPFAKDRKWFIDGARSAVYISDTAPDQPSTYLKMTAPDQPSTYLKMTAPDQPSTYLKMFDYVRLLTVYPCRIDASGPRFWPLTLLASGPVRQYRHLPESGPVRQYRHLPESMGFIGSS